MNTPVIIIIPARLESIRLPRKLLLAETGKPLIQHTWEATKGCRFSELRMVTAIATDSDEIADTCHGFGAPVLMTSLHPNGTSRIAAVVSQFGVRKDGANDTIVNVQADEPEIDPALINKVVAELQAHPEWDCVTAAVHGTDFVGLANPNRVKVVRNTSTGIAEEFSRYSIHCVNGLHAACLHIGIYAYRAAALRKYAAAGPCEREVAESLEQLRALHIGLKMGVVLWGGPHHAGIDTRADYDAFVERWKEKQCVKS